MEFLVNFDFFIIYLINIYLFIINFQIQVKII